jgi:flagellar hook-basal body complex protein FliE
MPGIAWTFRAIAALKSALAYAAIPAWMDLVVELKPINQQIAQALSALRAPAAAATPGAPAASFGASLDAALSSISRNQQSATELQRQFQLEHPNVSLEETMIAMNKAQLSFQAAVQVRNRLVQAYDQVMNMSV